MSYSPTTYTPESFTDLRAPSRGSPTHSHIGLNVFDLSHRAQVGQDLIDLFQRSRSSSSSGSRSGASSSSSSSAGDRTPSRRSGRRNNSEEMFITWPESRPLSSSRSASPTQSESGSIASFTSSSISLPDYHSPNSTIPKRIKGKKPLLGSNSLSSASLTDLFKPPTPTEPEHGYPRTPSPAYSSSSWSLSPTLVDRESINGFQSEGIKVTVETHVEVSYQAKWECDLELSSASTNGMRRNGPGRKGDRWNGNWI
jgi:hypothetical protein